MWRDVRSGAGVGWALSCQCQLKYSVGDFGISRWMNKICLEQSWVFRVRIGEIPSHHQTRVTSSRACLWLSAGDGWMRARDMLVAENHRLETTQSNVLHADYLLWGSMERNVGYNTDDTNKWQVIWNLSEKNVCVLWYLWGGGATTYPVTTGPGWDRLEVMDPSPPHPAISSCSY